MDKTTLKDATSQKILETTRETERLKQELEALIASGIHGRAPIPAFSQQPLESANKVQIIKSYDPKHSQHTKRPLDAVTATSNPKIEAETISPKKPKTYDVKEAREYIKKQRDKRMEELKNKKSSTQIAAEIRKEKLQELQLKANEILKKNVEAKRGRAKLREEPARSRSSGTRDNQQILRSRSQSRDKGNLAAEDSVIHGFNCADKSRKVFITSKDKQNLHSSRSRPTKAVSMDCLNSIGKLTRPADCNAKGVARNTLGSLSNRNPNLLCPPQPVYGVQLPKEVEKFNVNSAAKAQAFTIEDKSGRSEPINATNKEKSVVKSLSHSSLGNKSSNNIKILSNVTLRKPFVDSIVPPIVEQQQIKQTPDWLQQQAQADPYNFINTVKRQLQYVVNEKRPEVVAVDVAVQGNLEKLISPLQSGKSDLKSFISHKCLNLDPRTIEHIELHKGFYASGDGPTITKPPSGSDSDTSKNIPSISSESGSSLRRNAEFIRHQVSDLRPLEVGPPNLDAGRVEDVQLKEPIKPSIPKSSLLLSVPKKVDGLDNVKKQLFKNSSQSDLNNYSSDFISTDLSKSRESIISFNCASVSPNRVPLFMPEAVEEAHSIQNDTDKEDKDNAFLASDDVSTQPKGIGTGQRQTGSLESQEYGPLFSTLHPSSNDSSEPGRSRRSDSRRSQKSREDAEPKTGGSSSEILTRASSRSIRSQSTKNLDKITELLSERKSFTSESSSSEAHYLQPAKSKSGSEETSRVVSVPTFPQDEEITGLLAKKRLPTGAVSSRTITLETAASSDTASSANSCKNAQNSLLLFKSKSDKDVVVVSKKPFRSGGIRGLSKSEANIYEDQENIIAEPKLSLNIKRSANKTPLGDSREALMKNITVRSGGDETLGDLNNTNEIHLKFEAEIHLLSDFNKSIRRFSEIEKAFESLRAEDTTTSKTPMNKKALQDRDTQTSHAEIKLPSESALSELALDLTQRSAGDVDSVLTTTNFEVSLLDNNQSDKTSSSAMRFSGSTLNESLRERADIIGDENLVFKSVVGMSLKMFDQLIKDEDARIENWKKVIKIREQALLDRTKGELVWLEMQKKQLIETGNLAEASLLKKRQRGILLKHQQEKHEMQRLKQMQKQDSHNRKAQLKKERNQIKKQLLSDAMLSKLKPATRRDRHEKRLSGPFKVVQHQSTTVRSETSLSKATDQEIKSITTQTSRTHSIVNIVSETSDIFNTDPESLDLAFGKKKSFNTGAISNMKKELLMREHALAKRRKTVEELLQWHKKLLNEEKAIEDLEGKIGTMIISKTPPSESHEVSIHVASEEVKNIPATDDEIQTEDSNRVVSSANYSLDFEPAPNSDEPSSESSISQLIEDFSKIEDNILSLMTKRKEETEVETPQEEAKTEISSHSLISQIDSDPKQTVVEDDSVIIIEEPAGETTLRSADSLVEIQEIATSESGSKQASDSEQSISNQVPLDDDTNTIISALDLVNSGDVISVEDHVETGSEIVDTKTDQTLEVIEIADVTVDNEAVVVPLSNHSERSSTVTFQQPEEEPKKQDDDGEDDNDVSTFRQYEEIEDFPVSNLEQEPSSTSPQDGDSSTPVIALEPPLRAEEDRQSYENKTDEEKAASLSNSRGSISSVEKSNASQNAPESEEKRPTAATSTTSSNDSSIDSIEESYTSTASVDTVESPQQQPKTSEDIKKHVQEILNVVSPVARGDKSPRMQDLCLITYDTSPGQSPDSGSPMDERKPFSLGSEAEELHRKQLAIEQEVIKLLKEQQQQQETVAPFYVREIPNKPPPPYTPPSKAKAPKIPSVIPVSKEEIEKITEYAAKIIYKAYMSSNLDNITISDNTLSLIAKNIDKGCFKYVFDLCKEIAKDHYSQFIEEAGPSWLQVDRKPVVAPVKPLDVDGLKNLMSSKLSELFGFEKQETKRENAIMKWSRKKRDHVDEVLVQEMQVEEVTWTNFDRDEALVKDRITNEIMEMLLKDTAQVLKKALQKKTENV